MTTIIAYTDGSLSHKGEMGIGVCVYEGAELLYTLSEYIGKVNGKASGNYAEHMAMLRVLQYIETYLTPHEHEVIIYTDSKLVANQMSFLWQVGHGIYAPAAMASVELIKRLRKKRKFKIKVEWISRKHNSEADTLSKETHTHRSLVETFLVDQ